MAVERVMRTAPVFERTPCPRCAAPTALVLTGSPDHTVRLDPEPHGVGRYIIVEPGDEFPDLGPIAVQVGVHTAEAIRRYTPPSGRPTPLYRAHEHSDGETASRPDGETARRGDGE